MKSASVFSVVAIAVVATVAVVVLIVVPSNMEPKPREVVAAAPDVASKFDGDRAMKYLDQICAIGPRLSATEEMKKQQEVLQTHFEKCGAKVTLQKFNAAQTSVDHPIPMANMIVSWDPEAKRRVIICGHYDTRPIADQETNVRDWRKPFLSANDGTSTVAFLMELAHHMGSIKRSVGVDFILFDGEEYIWDRTKDKFFLGSEYFARTYKADKPDYKYEAGILLDLFAQKGATYRFESNSKFMAGEVLADVWGIAKALGFREFVAEDGWEVSDDHIALNRVGIPCIDIIDMDYKHWHRLTDTPDKCSGTAMSKVAQVIAVWIEMRK